MHTPLTEHDPARETLGTLAAPVPPLTETIPALSAYEAFSANASLYAIAVVDTVRRPVGILNRFKFLEQLSRPYGRELALRQAVSSFMDASPLVVDEELSLDELSTMLVGDDSRYIFDGFIVTHDGGYLGIGTGYSLIRRLTERKHAALFHMAHHDSLTGLPNRQLFSAQLTESLAHAQQHGQHVGVLYVDLDRFKAVNDSYGHLVGDLLLQSVAMRLRGAVRAGDAVARLSGDEFAVVLNQLNAEEHADTVAAHLLSVIRQPHSLDGHEAHISCSIGIAVYPGDATSQGALLRAADAAVYHAKRFRNTFQRYSRDLLQGHAVGLQSYGSVKRAVEEGHLSVYYQPQVDTRTGALYGVEALVRWTDRERGLQSTPELIRLAEDSGLISEVTNLVLEQAMTQVVAWTTQGLIKDLTLAVNISSVELRDGHLVPMIERHMAATGFIPGHLELEITESTAMLSGRTAGALLTALTSMGIHLSIDDFGTGYSSLSRLRRLPVHAVKIDRTFVEDIEHRQSGALAQAIILMAHSLGLSVTGEGVETERQWDFLEANGCDRVQGYLISRPLPAHEMTAFLNTSTFTPLSHRR